MLCVRTRIYNQIEKERERLGELYAKNHGLSDRVRKYRGLAIVRDEMRLVFRDGKPFSLHFAGDLYGTEKDLKLMLNVNLSAEQITKDVIEFKKFKIHKVQEFQQYLAREPNMILEFGSHWSGLGGDFARAITPKGKQMENFTDYEQW